MRLEPPPSNIIEFGFNWRQWLAFLFNKVDTLDSERVRWLNLWSVGTYQKNDVVRAGNWTRIANKITSDEAEPYPSGVPIWSFPDTPTWIIQNSPDDIATGIRIVALNASLVISGRLWIQNTTYEYTVQSWDMSRPSTPILINSETLPPGNPVGWYGLSFDERLITKGSDILFTVISHATIFDINYSSQWRFFNQDPPGIGIFAEISTTLLKISEQSDSGAWGTELLLLKFGDTIKITETADALRWREYLVTAPAVSQSGHVEVTMEIFADGDAIRTNRDVIVDWVIKKAEPVDYPELPGWFLGNPNISGYINSDISSPGGAVYNDNGYGLDLYVDSFIDSPDWDTWSYSG